MSTDTAFCGECGTQIAATSKFCPTCGARQDAFAAPEATPPAPPAPEPPQPAPTPPVAQPTPPPAQPAPPVVPPAPHAAPPVTPPPVTPPPPGGATPPPPPPPPQQPPHGGGQQFAQDAARRLDQVSPDAGDLARQLGQQLNTPGVILAALAAAGGLVAALVLGLVSALVFPDDSLIGRFGADSGFVTEALRLAVGSTMARLDFGSDGTTIVPLLYVLAPLLGTAAVAYLQSSRTAAMAPRFRLLWGAAAGIPLTVAMVILALVGGGDIQGTDVNFTMGSVIGFSLLWGALGGLLGTWYAIHTTAPETEAGILPPQAGLAGRAILTPLKPLAVLLAVIGVLSLLVWEVQTIKDEDQAKAGRGTVIALVENVLLTPNFAINSTGAGMFASFVNGPLPVSNGNASIDFAENFKADDDSSDSSDDDDDDADFGSEDDPATTRLFAYSDATPVYVFIPGLILFILLPIAFALYAGFATARRMGAATLAAAAGWGALTGVVWSLTLVILRSIAADDVLVGDSLFGWTLLIGLLAGAAGGALAASNTGAPRPGVPRA